MNAEGIKDVLRAVGHTSQMSVDGGWVRTTCPFAAWRHDGGHDTHPSFGVHIEEDGTSIFNCFGCKAKGPLVYLLNLMERYTGEDYKELRRDIDNNELYMSVMPEWTEKTGVRKFAPLKPIDEHMLSIYPLATSSNPYLYKRYIESEQVIYDLELRIDPNNKGAERILFPVRGVDGKLYGFTGRATDDEVTPKVRDYFGLPKRQLLLGAHAINPEQPVILVEGLFDYAMMRQYGYQSMAVMHSSITEQQAMILKDLGAALYIFFDNDKAGKIGAIQVEEVMKPYVPVWRISYPKGCNDPAELEYEEVEEMIDRATLA
jgi:DNA primase